MDSMPEKPVTPASFVMSTVLRYIVLPSPRMAMPTPPADTVRPFVALPVTSRSTPSSKPLIVPPRIVDAGVLRPVVADTVAAGHVRARALDRVTPEPHGEVVPADHEAHRLRIRAVEVAVEHRLLA